MTTKHLLIALKNGKYVTFYIPRDDDRYTLKLWQDGSVFRLYGYFFVGNDPTKEENYKDEQYLTEETFDAFILQVVRRFPEIGLWRPFGGGSTTGQPGSEAGTILEDLEFGERARITLENDTRIAPMAVTFGIYGLMVHTHYAGTEDEARKYVVSAMQKIETMIAHLEKGEDFPGWYDTYKTLADDLIA